MSQKVTFRVEIELEELLNRVPNRSGFIRKAILAYLSNTCPFCIGKGMLPFGMQTNIAEILKNHAQRPSAGCALKLPVPFTDLGVGETDRARVGQFLHGDPYYCAGCHAALPACPVCGWHLPPAQLAEHELTIHQSAE